LTINRRFIKNTIPYSVNYSSVKIMLKKPVEALSRLSGVNYKQELTEEIL